MKSSRPRVSSATLFFALLSLTLGIALYIRTHPSRPERPEQPPVSVSPRPRQRASPRPRVAAPGPSRSPSRGGEQAIPRVAIVIDDLGNDTAAAERIARWPFPVTGAVLPALPGSARTARRLEEAGKQVLLHLPMEPRGYPEVRPGPGVVLRSQTAEQIVQTLQSDLESIPGAVGVSNHMGSAATADSRVMQAIARVLARRGLFFVDSRTTDATVASEVIRREQVPFVSRRVFLDDRATPEAIRQTLSELVADARRGGSALGLGHPYPATLDVLEHELPGLASRGVRLVNVSELVE